MSLFSFAFLATAAALSQPMDGSECRPGAYASDNGDFVVLSNVASIPPPGLRYMFRDGRRGSTQSKDAPLFCLADAVEIVSGDAERARWVRMDFKVTDASFDSAGTRLEGQLIEPRTSSNRKPPLVVMVHGSERSPAIGNIYAYALAAQGIAVFAYDKRGTGASEGEYTQNFELLAEDAANALRKAKELAGTRISRAGYFGGSQGGWVAPLAATRSDADFVAVGFGLVASPIEEDREQMISEVRALGLGKGAEALVNKLSEATARLLLSDFSEGYEELDEIRRQLGANPWLSRISGEHSGEILKLDNQQLRRIGRARFDNLELIWDYDAVAALEKLQAPLLWVLAAEDREAPIEGTRRALLELRSKGRNLDAFVFPGTDHGMMEFRVNPDGSRTATRITDGYLQLLGDWIKGETRSAYGRSFRLGGSSQLKNAN